MPTSPDPQPATPSTSVANPRRTRVHGTHSGDLQHVALEQQDSDRRA